MISTGCGVGPVPPTCISSFACAWTSFAPCWPRSTSTRDRDLL